MLVILESVTVAPTAIVPEIKKDPSHVPNVVATCPVRATICLTLSLPLYVVLKYATSKKGTHLFNLTGLGSIAFDLCKG